MIDSPLNYFIVAHLVKYAARQQSAENPQAEPAPIVPTPTRRANPLYALLLARLGRRLVNLGERLEGCHETSGRFAVES